MKAYTDIEQSKKLAEILPIESADMSYRPYREEGGIPDYRLDLCPYRFASWSGFPCWSLAALLNVVSEEVSLNSFKDGNWNAMVQQNGKMIYSDADDPVDACVEMIEKLHIENLI